MVQRIGPTAVLVLSLCFIGFVVMLVSSARRVVAPLRPSLNFRFAQHIWGKFQRNTSA